MKNFTFTLFLGVFLFAFAGTSNAQDVVDLTGIDNPNILADTLPDAPAGAVVLLEPGMVYQTGGYEFDKSLTLQSADPSDLNLPQIDCTDNFNFTDGAMVDSIIFKNIEFWGEFDARYVLNSNVSADIGEFRFESCNIHNLRGILRMKDNGPGTLDSYVIMDCVIDSIRDYGIITVDRDDWMVNNIMIKNSTISRTRSFLTSRNNSNSVVIENCTMFQVTATGQRMFRWRTDGQDNVAEGINIQNTIWGHAWDEENTGDYGIDGYDGLGATAWTFVNLFTTNDVAFAAEKDTIIGFTDMMYNGAAEDLWVDPYNGNFNYQDTAFVGLGFSGDPRWAVATENGGREWNISWDAYNALGEIDSTQTVLGLTIYAHSEKKVTVDENEKTLDDMMFTNRLKFGGSGDFDDDGMPLGRVLSIEVSGNTTFTVAAMSSSSSEDRVLNIATGNEDAVWAEFPALGESLTSGMYTYMGGPAKILFFSPSSGVNIYYIKSEPLATNVKRIDNDQNILVYPNPARDRVFVNVNQPTQVGIYNLAGTLVKSKMVYSRTDAISVNDLQSGMYLIRSQNDNSFAKKLIVK